MGETACSVVRHPGRRPRLPVALLREDLPETADAPERSNHRDTSRCRLLIVLQTHNLLSRNRRSKNTVGQKCLTDTLKLTNTCQSNALGDKKQTFCRSNCYWSVKCTVGQSLVGNHSPHYVEA